MTQARPQARPSYGLQFGETRMERLFVGDVWVVEAPRATKEFEQEWRKDSARLIKLGYIWKHPKAPVKFWKRVHSEEELEATRAASRAEDANIDIPRPHGLEYMPFQRGGIAFADGRDGVLIGDEMGLGKTIQAIGIANFMQPRPRHIMVGCPASLKGNWKEEIMKWQVLHLPVYVISREFEGFPTGPLPAGWYVVSWEVAQKYEHELKTKMTWDLVILDEIHKLKTMKAARTKFFLGGTEKGEDGKKKEIPPIRAKKRVALTGTPICNKPLELWPFLTWLQPERFNNLAVFRNRFCGGSVNGASNLHKLQDVLRTSVMVRRLKSQVLKDLPPKQRQVVVLDINDGDYRSRRIVEEEIETYDRTLRDIENANYERQKAQSEGNEESYDAAVAKLKAARGIHFTQMSRVRHATALAKVPYVIEHLKDLDETKKYIIFAHHNDVIEQLCRAMSSRGALMMTQKTAIEERQAIAHRFQDDPRIHFIFGTYGTMGVGFTLTASSDVIGAELDWVPGNVTQAEDRAHRIGQNDSVLVQHLVFDGSLDGKMAKTLVAKQVIIDKALDHEKRPEDDEDDDSIASEERREKREKPWRKDAPINLTAAQIMAIHSALRAVAGSDADRAREINGVGFNKIDTRFGCELADKDKLTPRQADAGARMVRKYRRQYPKELYVQIFNETW
jgi:SWI/SNF-related matrix-associated actin-dependent regulator of chromatin subfamily A-like protein 1